MYIYPRIRSLRKNKKLTQAEIAQYLGEHLTQYRRWETGESEIPVHIVLKLCKLYNVPIDWLLGHETNNAVQIHEKIRTLRKKQDLTQAEVAKIIGTNQKVYSRYETGENKIPIDRLIMLCNFYKVSADWILGLPKSFTYLDNNPI